VLRKSAQVHRLGPLRALTTIYVPSCSTEIIGGISLGVSYAFVAVIASEFLLAPAGIGHDIADAYMSFKIDRMYGLMLALVLLTIIINATLRHLRTRVGAPAT
jgi:NitT/TauT family transport system permease protein